LPAGSLLPAPPLDKFDDTFVGQFFIKKNTQRIKENTP